MPPYNFPIEQLTHTATLKCSSGKQETLSPKPPEPEKTEPNPMGPIAHWPPEMLRIVKKNPNIRMLLIEAFERDEKECQAS